MRVSADRDSEFYMGNERYEVWLDGKRITHVIAADEENGWVITFSDTGPAYRKILRGRVTILNPRLLPVCVPRKPMLTVMVMAGSVITPRTRMLIDHFVAAGAGAEVVIVSPDYSGMKPDGVWIDDIEALFDNSFRRAMAKVRNELLYGTGDPLKPPIGLLQGTWTRGVVKFKETPPVFASGERAWQTKKRKGRS